jgi:hypothetical protein
MSLALSNRIIRLALLMIVGVGLLTVIVYMARRSSCETDAHALVGEVRRVSGGTLLYFDGRCWTTKPMPPTDTPF